MSRVRKCIAIYNEYKLELNFKQLQYGLFRFFKTTDTKEVRKCKQVHRKNKNTKVSKNSVIQSITFV